MRERRRLFKHPVRTEMAKVLVALGGTAKNGTLLARWSDAVPPEYFGNRKGPRQSWDAVKAKLFIECLRSMEDSGFIVRDNTAGWTCAYKITLTEEGKKFAASGEQTIAFWSAEEMKLFGKYTDERIAVITGRTVQAVQHCRNSNSIAPYMPKARPWTQAEIDLVGTKPDAAVSAKINRSVNAVRNKRAHLGRPVVLDAARFHKWTPEENKQLGTMSDSMLAKKLGVTKESVFGHRKRLGIAPNRPYRRGVAAPPVAQPVQPAQPIESTTVPAQ